MKLKNIATTFFTLVFAMAAGSPSVCGAAAAANYNVVERLEFNRIAAEQFLPLFWRDDINKDGNIQPDELAVLIGFGNPHENEISHWVKNHHFTPAFANAYQRIVDARKGGVPATERLKLVKEELDQGRPTLIETDLSGASAHEISMVKHLVKVARMIDALYQRQTGMIGLDASIPASDLASRMLFYRNQSPFCEAPLTRGNKACNALASYPAQLSGLYPVAIQKDSHFCDKLAGESNAAELMDHFSVVVKGKKPGSYQAVPYNLAYRKDMQVIATELEAAASELDDSESAFRNYLRVAAQSFRSNDWEPANRAWVAMSATNSKWYARIAPDEVYYEPCAWKAGFALQLARINSASLAWQKKIEPMKNEMEQLLASMAGAPYKARNVQFKIPDFIEVVLNAGDQRNAFTPAIGQSLPNWGPVAESGGRTVTMVNIFTDIDSFKAYQASISSLLCANANQYYVRDDENQLLASMLHEIAHNLGPAHEYRVAGRTDIEAFGGPLSSTLEELKAENSSRLLTDWLTTKNLFTPERRKELHIYGITWDFGHISRGMYTADQKPQNYSQLAAIQLGWFMQQGGVIWKADQMAANGADKGCLDVDFDKLPAAVESLETRVLQIKARNDKQAAEQLVAGYVDAKNDFAKLKDTITERWLRAPKGTPVYSIRY